MDFTFRDALTARLLDATPDLLATQDPHTGRFGEGIWIVTDQNVLFPMAAAWATPGAHYHYPDLLAAIVRGGDALIDDQDERGMWEFRKKDGSTWGPIFMPWTYSRWLRAFGIIREAMSEDARRRWEDALLLGYEGIADTALGRIHNIPAHHAMGLYHAGQLFDNAAWRDQARDFLMRVCEDQHADGYWSEHVGPVVACNFVYAEALGVYHAQSGDCDVLPTLERAASFRAEFVYPDGSRIETIDERNPYHAGAVEGNVGFSFCASGREFLRHQWQHVARITPDTAASFLLYGREGSLPASSDDASRRQAILGRDDAVVRREGPWFVCLSAFVSPLTENRWVQDRQNFVSIYHDRLGLVLGGGNTKLQPRWSNFTAGEMGLLAHEAGDTNPAFAPPPGLVHVPSQIALDAGSLSLELDYGTARTRLTVEILDDARVCLRYDVLERDAADVRAHLTFLPTFGSAAETAAGPLGDLSEEPFAVGDCGGWIAHGGWRLSTPHGAEARWPVAPHNPYRKDGHAEVSEGRLVVSLPFSAENAVHRCVLEAL